MNAARRATQIVNTWVSESSGLPLSLSLTKLGLLIAAELGDNQNGHVEAAEGVQTVEGVVTIHGAGQETATATFARPEDYDDNPAWTYRRLVYSVGGWQFICHAYIDMPLDDFSMLDQFAGIVTKMPLAAESQYRPLDN